MGRYTTPHKYTPEELEAARVADLLNDARCADDQAASGPYYPEKGITQESLTRYAADCRQKAARHA